MQTQTFTSEQVAQALQSRIHGQVLTDDKTLMRNSTDWSIYQIRPLAVVAPRTWTTSWS